jgi:acetyl-CoA carboxylase carboxyltransferase component
MTEETHDELLLELARREARADEGGGRARLARLTRLGRLGVRERIAALVDAGSFVELGRHVMHRHAASSEQLAANVHPGDGVVCGLAAIDGRGVAVYAHDPTVLRGALGVAASKKICKLLDLAEKKRLPVITLADSDGVRVDEGTDAIDAYGEIIRRTVRLKGKVPQLTLVCGLCVGAAAYNAALTDLVAMVGAHGFMFITGAKVTKVVTGEGADITELGGAEMHATKTGACHAIVADEREGIAWLRRVLSYVGHAGARVASDDPTSREVPEIATLVPTAPRRAYDMRKVVATIFDRATCTELSPRFAPNLLTFLARLGGRAVAVVASQPMALAGCLDVDASRKGAAFVTWVSAMRLPIVTLVDVPGYLPGTKQEQAGILPHGAALLTAYASATVPMVCLVVRKSFGGASVLSFASDVRLALTTARIAPMGADAAVEVALGPVLDDASEETQRAREARRAEWLAQHDHAWASAEAGYVDQVIRPADARRVLAQTVERLAEGIHV